MCTPDAPDRSSSRETVPSAPEGCTHPWCTTAHGATSHPDDEDHRSVGLVMPAVVRSLDRTMHDTEIEVGLLHRHDDGETWLVIEDGRDVHLEITLATARRLALALRTDPGISAALGLALG